MLVEALQNVAHRRAASFDNSSGDVHAASLDPLQPSMSHTPHGSS